MGCLASLRATTTPSYLDRVFCGGTREYSIERLFAFREYCQRASALRVFLVLSLNLSLPFVVLLAIDLVPLQDPSAGWRGNPTFLARTAVNGVIVVGGIMVKAALDAPEVLLTARRIVIIVGGVCAGYLGTLVLIAEVWTFPVPFAPTLAGIPLCIMMPVSAAIALGTRDRAQLWAFLHFANNIAVQATLTLVYPSYNAIFLKLKGTSQLAFVLVLPVMKFTFKRVIAWVQTPDDDLVPALLSTVDIFDALYMTKCMQSAGSIEVACGIILVDVVQSLIAMFGIVRQTRTLRKKYALQKRNNATGSAPTHELLSDTAGEDESPLFSFLVIRMKQLKHTSVRLKSTRQYVISSEARAQVDLLQSINVVPPLTKQRQEHQAKAPKLALNSVVPACQNASGEQPTLSDEELAERQLQDLVQESVRLLHECETVGVIEYIETVTPVFYALYISILFHLPNAKYYEDMRELTTEKLHSVVLNILVYAAMELASLVWVHRMLRRNFGISLFHQIAFTLESEWRLFQTSFLIWILVVFQFLLDHHGTDFTFKFAWIGDHVNSSLQSASQSDTG